MREVLARRRSTEWCLCLRPSVEACPIVTRSAACRSRQPLQWASLPTACWPRSAATRTSPTVGGAFWPAAVRSRVAAPCLPLVCRLQAAHGVCEDVSRPKFTHSQLILQASTRWNQHATRCWPSWRPCPSGEPAVARSAGLCLVGRQQGLLDALRLSAPNRPRTLLAGACLPCPGPTLRSPTAPLASSKVPGVGKVTQKVLARFGVQTGADLLEQRGLLEVRGPQGAWCDYHG